MSSVILSIDPGTTNTGVALLSYEETIGITVLHVETIYTPTLLPLYKDVEYLYGLRHAKITIICERIRQLIQIYNPYEVVCEDTYYSPDTPQAKFALMELISALRSMIYTQFYSLPLMLVEASFVKRSLSIKGNSSNKDLIKQTLYNLPLLYGVGITVSLCDEHGCDAIAIGYSRLSLI